MIPLHDETLGAIYVLLGFSWGKRDVSNFVGNLDYGLVPTDSDWWAWLHTLDDEDFQ